MNPDLDDQRLSKVFLDASDPILIEDLDGFVIDMNHAAEDVYGWTRSQFIGQPIKRIVPTERHDQADELLERCRSGEDVRNVEGLRITRSGVIVTVLITLSLLKDDDGKPTAVASFVKDISDLRAAEEQSRTLSRVFRDASDPILIEDLDGLVIDLNRAAETAYGWSREEFIGQPIKRIVPSERHGQADELLERCRSGGDVRNVEGLRITRVGDVVTVLITLSLLHDEEGQSASVASFVKDITELKTAESKLQEYSKDLERMVEERTTALEEAKAQLEHELRVAHALSEEADRQHEIALMGESIAVRALREAVESHARSDDPLLLTGPPGAGQEAVARGIHRLSSRSGRPFIFVDCARLVLDDTATLFSPRSEDETESPGRAALAHHGTLYLENVEALPAQSQIRLLDYLIEATERRQVGQVPELDVRIITYSTRDIQGEVRQDRLDPTLANALSRRRLTVPSLAERREDIPMIAEQIVKDRGRARGRVFDGITRQSVEKLVEYGWPENISELRNVMERAVMVATGTSVDVDEDLLDHAVHLGGYRLVRGLGGGGMGEVWLASHDLLARPAAVKLIRSEFLDTEPEERKKMERRFEQEAKVTAQLRSPHTVELYDFGMSDRGEFYYVMEHLSGWDLGSMVNSFGTMEAARTIYLLEQACLSLAEAHDAGLVHRDIKPANLFACRLGSQYDFLKVLDFGIVKLLRSDESGLTGTGAVPGTPAYLAPELIFGDTPPDLRADLYALGCVAYFLLTGCLVFEAESVMDMMRSHLDVTPGPPSERASVRVPKELDAVVLQCLEKDPEKRPASALELRGMLRAIHMESAWSDERAAKWWADHAAALGKLMAEAPPLPGATPNT